MKKNFYFHSNAGDISKEILSAIYRAFPASKVYVDENISQLEYYEKIDYFIVSATIIKDQPAQFKTLKENQGRETAKMIGMYSEVKEVQFILREVDFITSIYSISSESQVEKFFKKIENQ